MSEKLLVVGETKDGTLRNVSFEAIGAAKKINENAEIIGVVCGDDDLESQALELIYYGADRVVTVKHDNLKTYTSEGFGQAILAVINDESPAGIVMGHTSIGKDLSPKLASKLNTGLVSDVTEIEITENHLAYIRPIYSGKAFEKKIITGNFPFITIRPNNIPSLERDTARTGNIRELDIEVTDIRTIVTDVIRKATEGVDLSEAKIVVAGGRGVKSAEGFKPLYELADALGGAVGASRGACDADYCDYSLQIGQTGKVVTPDLYIAVGISGAIQHLAGMSNSKVIVAINKDPEANIFNIADYGIVGDLFEIIPLLIEEINKMKVG
ncbi:electron transfer flavoprotein subunit alpha/FixB family protein [Oceanobacillus sp. 143]|uniref:Electron transfer flavoprotein subunit alpha n=1 Tax=Oceanobacillus zhaokaii TaxID=2052660 RepID=A0A345PHZ6_9BACI|nr:electron transfer flavoprotein subunit alpha/FixB family protein [Oceanobacillus zhaokaii]AXI09626.1 electron transfer flavoprotein subunit alpha [Oceanobacillus zhaokaii]QGS68980.1 electron transfer flavoprotein subunit alpha/FixB family protein [Oceanobacillus sp. 143]